MDQTNDSQATGNPHTESPFDKLTATQWRFITAMLEDRSRTKKDAAAHLGISEQTVYRWDKHVNEALELALADLHAAALEYRKQQLLKAIAVKVAGLDSDDESIRHKTATELIEWELGRAVSRQEHTGAGGSALEFRVVYENIEDA